MRAEALRLADALDNIWIDPNVDQDGGALDRAAALLRQWPEAGEAVAWRHDCAALLINDVELWIDACPHCGKPRTAATVPQADPVDQQVESINAVFEAWRNGEDASMTLALAALPAAPGAAPSQQPAPDLKHCACEFDGDTCVTQCKLHGAHVDAIHEWAERAKAAEAKLAQAAQGGMVMVPREPTQEMLAAAYAADKEYQQRMGVGDLVSVGPYDHYRAMIAAAPQAVPQPQPLTDEQFSDIVADASLAVDLAANPLKLLAFARAVLSAAPAVREPLTDEQVDEIWDGTFDSADPKRKLSFRQSITRAIERAHGIGITAKGDGNG